MKDRMPLNSDSLKTLQAVVLYILQNTKREKCDVYSVVKTAFFAQQIHLAEWGTPLYDDVICALPFGPVPSNIYDALRMARGDASAFDYHIGDGLSSIADTITYSNESFSAKESPDMNWLSESDVESLDKAIKKIAKMSFSKIMSVTHAGAEYQRAINTTGIRRMDDIEIARDGGAKDAALAHLSSYIDTMRVLAK